MGLKFLDIILKIHWEVINLSNLFYHPLGENALSIQPYTRANHGVGKLDFNGNHTPFYAMCDGEITNINTYSPDFNICQKCTDNGLNKTFYIRYLHGVDYTVSVGDYVTKGTLLGYTSNNNGLYNDHLHIDFSWVDNNFDPVEGIISEDKSKFIIQGEEYSINTNNSNFWNKVDEWKNTSGSSTYGYCWLVFGQNPSYKTANIKGNSELLKVKVDDYTIKMLVGLVANECSWKNAAVAQGTLTVCRNWIYADCIVKLGKNSLSFTQSDFIDKNEMAQHFARFVTGEVDWSLIDKYLNNYTSYYSKTVPGTNLTCYEFVQQFLTSGKHWTYIDQAIKNGKATLHSGYNLIETEDAMGFPSSSSDNQRLMLIPPFGDWILNWNYLSYASNLTKPSQLLSANNSINTVLKYADMVIKAHYNYWINSIGLSNTYYNNGAYLDTTLNGIKIHSRRDCSGYIGGILQMLGDIDLNYWCHTDNFIDSGIPNWNMYRISDIGISNLQPGDIVDRRTSSSRDGHTEIIVSNSDGIIKSYGLGSDYSLRTCGTGGNLTLNPNDYTYIFRRN